MEHIEILFVFRLFKSLVQHPIELLLDAALVVGLFHFQKCERDSVDEDIDIRPERAGLITLISFFSKSQFVHDSKIIVIDILKINEFHAVVGMDEPVMECLPQVVILYHCMDVLKNNGDFGITERPAVDFFNSRLKPIDRNACFMMQFDCFQRLVSVSYPHELDSGGYLYSCVLIEYSHIVSSLNNIVLL